MTDLPALATVGCVDLRCERRIDPIGLDATAPRLSWRIEAPAGEADVEQQACQVEVEGRWNSGRVPGWRQQVVYRGPALGSGESLRWRVRVWTTAGPTDWSGWATFETGILATGEWVATMVTAEVPTPVVRFARTLEVPDDVVRARLRVSATASSSLRSTAPRSATKEVLAPGWTSYHHRLAVRTYDVTDLVHAGAVEVAVLVGPGWFSGRIGFADAGPLYGTERAAFAQLELERADGTLVVVGTDGSWSASTTPYRRLRSTTGRFRRPAPGRRGAQSRLGRRGVRPGRAVCPAGPTRPSDRDGGPGGGRRQRLRLRAEPGRLAPDDRSGTCPPAPRCSCATPRSSGPDGELFTNALRTAKATDRYVAAGTGDEHYEPRFTFHGFRYAEITGVDPARSTCRPWSSTPTWSGRVGSPVRIRLLERLHRTSSGANAATSCHSRRIARSGTSASVGPVTRKCSRRRRRSLRLRDVLGGVVGGPRR